MPTLRTKGASVLNVQLDAELRTYLDQYATLRKETRRAIVERALRREFLDPPSLPEKTPLPPLDAPPPAGERAKRKGAK